MTGNNSYGQLGLGGVNNTVNQPAYLQSLQGIPVMQIACGAFHSMVLTVSGNIFSFGKNELVFKFSITVMCIISVYVYYIFF